MEEKPSSSITDLREPVERLFDRVVQQMMEG
jgi:hypothetical protein